MLKLKPLKYSETAVCVKQKIEKAANPKNIANVDWNVDTTMATLSFNENNTNQFEILKRIALTGYDNEKFLSTADVYAIHFEFSKY